MRSYLRTPHNQRQVVLHRREFIDRYIPNKSFYLDEADRRNLRIAGSPLPAPKQGTYVRRIQEQLLVDLSWASSRMEGNTYSLLETERLIHFGREAAGKDRKEVIMILNHKEAINYLIDNLDGISICRTDTFNIHALLADGLLADPNMAGRLRRMPIGISYSSYQPIDDQYAVNEEFDVILEKAAAIVDPFEQSFFVLVHIPYLQAFEDINKRTSRILSNIPLLKADLAPMSFLNMDDIKYIDGLIGVYELNNIALLREAFIDCYLASSENYRILRAELESPDKTALVYRNFVRESVRRCVLEWQDFEPDNIRVMAQDADIPEVDQEQVIAYIGREFRGLHEGNVIRYKLRPANLDLIKEK